MSENNRRPASRSFARGGFTLVELLVTIAIIAMMITAMLPAVQAMRTSARRAQCNNQLLQLIIAAQNHEMAKEYYPAGVTDPAGGPIRSVASGHHHGWLISLLPYLDEGIIHRATNFEKSVYDAANQPVRELTIPKLVCPMEMSQRIAGRSSYAACHNGVEAPIDADNRGVFFLNSRIMIDDVRDGLAQTIFLGEKTMDADDLGWMSGTRATLRNTGSSINSGRVPKAIIRDSDDPIRSDYGSPYGGYGGGYGGYGDEDYEDVDIEEEEEEEGYADDEEGGPEDADDEEEAELKGDNKEASNQEGETTEAKEQGATPTAAPPPTDLTVGGFGSYHPNGAHIAFGDGRIQFMTPQIDPRVYQLLGDRDDGTLLDAADYRD